MGSRYRHPAVVLVALFLGAFKMRPQIIAIAVLYPRLEQAFNPSHVAGGLLTAVPVVGLGVVAPLASVLIARCGPHSSRRCASPPSAWCDCCDLRRC